MLTKFIKKIQTYKILLAYSGGIDSTFLLYQFLNFKKKNNKFEFRTIHINHQLHLNSKKWSEHCKNVCKKHKIPIVIKKINIKKSGNIEEQSRKFRYAEIYKALNPNERIVTGHNLNDQCENIFLALKRGSGITGLSGMSYIQDTQQNKKKIIRPLLTVSRENIKKWMINSNISWIEDSSNHDIYHDRNFLRHKIIPKLKQRWPYFEKNCAKSIQILNEEKKILKNFTKKILKQHLISNSILNISTLKYKKKELFKIILRNWITLNQNIIPSFKIINEIYKQTLFSKIDSQPKIKIKNYQIQKYKNYIYLNKKIPNIENLILIWKNIEKNLLLPYKLGYITKNNFGTEIPYPQKNEIINIRFFTKKKFILNKNSKRTTLKKIFKINYLAPWYRQKTPLIFYNNNFICALGLCITYQKEINKNFNSKNKLKLSWINKI